MTRALLIAIFLLGCSPNEADDVLRACPSAPLGSQATNRCDFAGPCSYATPNGLLLGRPDGCNRVGCNCDHGEFVCMQTGLACSAPAVVKCAPSVVDGANCELPENGECERVEGDKRYACACDDPGPKWRCFAFP